MRRANPLAHRAKAVFGAPRWQVTLRRAYLMLAKAGAPEYSSMQCRMHWKVWSHCR